LQLIQSYINGILDLATWLHGIGITLSEDDVVDVIIFNLDKAWSNFASSLTTSQFALTIADVASMLMDEEGHCHDISPTLTPARITAGTALISRDGWKLCFHCNWMGHIKAKCITKTDVNGKPIIEDSSMTSSDQALTVRPVANEFAF
jgi:hypothetical protein